MPRKPQVQRTKKVSQFNPKHNVHAQVYVGSLASVQTVEGFMKCLNPPALWKQLFEGVQGQDFGFYDHSTELDMVVATPHDLGVRDELIPIQGFFRHVHSNFPSLEFLKMEAVFATRFSSYSVLLHETHYFAIPLPGAEMRCFDTEQKKIHSYFMKGGFRITGVRDRQRRHQVFRLIQPVPHYENHTVRLYDKWVFAYRRHTVPYVHVTEEK